MLVVVDVQSSDNGAWAQGIGCWEAIKPEHAVVDQFCHHSARYLGEGHSVVDTLRAFFDSADVPLLGRVLHTPQY